MKTVLSLLLLWLIGPLLNVSFAATQAQMLDPELRELHARGCSVYHEKHDREGGLKLFKELEARAIDKNNLYWLGSALWKQAQVFGDDGNQAGSIELFERSLASSSRDPDFAGSANHLLLLANLFMNYESRGQRGESLRIHQAMIPATGLNLMRTSKLPADTSLFDLPDDQLSKIKNMAFIGILYATEIRLRFESGDDAGALALAKKVDLRFAGTTRPREVTIYAGILETVVKLHLAAGRTAEAEAVLRRIIAFAEVPKTESYDEVLGARVDLALLRCRQGDDAGPLLKAARDAIEEARNRRWTQRRLVGTGKLARMLALTGDLAESRRTIDAAIDETRTLDEPKLLAELILTRAELQLDAGSTEGVQADLFETLKWYRQQGGLRAEAAAFVQNVRLLRLMGPTSDVFAALVHAKNRVVRFPDARQRTALNKETASIAARPPAASTSSTPRRNTGKPSISDLQPVELTTQVADEWSAKGRFILTNPGKDIVEGLIEARGAKLDATWDEARLEWQIRASRTGKQDRVEQRISLKPLDQATIVVSVDPSLAREGRIQLTWRDEGDDQSSWWNFAQAQIPSDLAVIDANLALENPFYSVPLHHYIVRGNPDAGTSQNLRVITTAPCRVELVDAATGKVLAVDATGDGDFRGVGDVIFADGNLDGLPDIRFDKNQRIAELEIQLYPLSTTTEVGVKLELQKRDGTWALSSTDRLLGKQ